MKNKVRKIMYGAVIVMLGLMSLKKLDLTGISNSSMSGEVEEVHTAMV